MINLETKTGKRSKTIEAAIKAHPERIIDYWAEKDCAGPWWILFADGWTYDNPTQRGYCGTAAELADMIRNARKD